MSQIPDVTALIPCYNEENRIAGVLRVVTNSSLVKKIVVVDDGSTDKSGEVVRQFREVILINQKENKGKGEAVREGLWHIDTTFTFMLDADLKGFKEEHIEKLVKPVVEGKCDVCIGVWYMGGPIFQFFRRRMLVFSGQRVAKTKIFINALKTPLTNDWGIEPWMNRYFRKNKLKVKIVDMIGLNHYKGQLKKVGFLKWLTVRPLFYLRVYTQMLFLDLLKGK